MTEADCRDVEELLPWYLEGALEAQESHAVAEHLVRCAECRAELAQVVRVQAQLRKAFREMPAAPVEAWDRVAARTKGFRVGQLSLGSFVAGLSLGLSVRRGGVPVSAGLRLLGQTVPLFEIGKGGRSGRQALGRGTRATDPSAGG